MSGIACGWAGSFKTDKEQNDQTLYCDSPVILLEKWPDVW